MFEMNGLTDLMLIALITISYLGAVSCYLMLCSPEKKEVSI